MKVLLYSFVVVFFFSCNKETKSSASTCIDIVFDEPFELQVGNSACLEDGRMIKLFSVEDQHCPCDILCDWGGQLLLSIELTDLDESTLVKELSISDSNSPNNTFEDINTIGLTYIYDGETDNLPLCIGIYDQEKISMVFTLNE